MEKREDVNLPDNLWYTEAHVTIIIIVMCECRCITSVFIHNVKVANKNQYVTRRCAFELQVLLR